LTLEDEPGKQVRLLILEAFNIYCIELVNVIEIDRKSRIEPDEKKS